MRFYQRYVTLIFFIKVLGYLLDYKLIKKAKT